MASLQETHCCGIRELNHVQDVSSAKEAIADAARDWFDNDRDGAFIFYSVTKDYLQKGDGIKKYIEKKELGTVFKTRSLRNPNSENLLTMYLWQVNKKNFEKFYQTI